MSSPRVTLPKAPKAPALRLSNDRKVSPKSVYEKAAKRWKPIVPNSFGLLAGTSCPDKTAACTKICYAANLERVFSSARRLVAGNLELLQACGANVAKMVELLAPMVEEWLATCDRVEKKTGTPVSRAFRIHWDGDFYSLPYAAAWAQVCKMFPQATFWAYTRSFVTVNVIPVLANVPNLTVYLSVDSDNKEAAKAVSAQFPQVRLAFLGDDWTDAEGIAREVSGRNAPKCPALTGKTPMVNEEGIGACIACGLCIRGTNNVRFAVH